jgi:hypothetical protein
MLKTKRKTKMSNNEKGTTFTPEQTGTESRVPMSSEDFGRIAFHLADQHPVEEMTSEQVAEGQRLFGDDWGRSEALEYVEQHPDALESTKPAKVESLDETQKFPEDNSNNASVRDREHPNQ